MVEDLLAEVKAGKIVTVAIATQLRAGKTGTVYSTTDGSDIAAILLAMERLKFRLMGYEHD